MATEALAWKSPRPQQDSPVITCKACGQAKDISLFYRHPKATTGRDSTCKECRKEAVRANRAAKGDYYRAYDRARYRDDPERQKAARRSANSPVGKALRREWLAAERQHNSERYKARNAVSNALRDGKLERSPCYFCGSDDRLQAHHEDYNRPLDVLWLCASCHGKLHAINGDFLRVG